MFRKELCVPSAFVPSVHSVSKMISVIWCKILNTEYTDVYCQEITRST